MKAKEPETGTTYYFIDKCLPFGSSISCSHFQRFSNALKHIMIHRGKDLTKDELDFTTNYLDDFLFLARTTTRCNKLIRRFLSLCKELDVPVAEDKTE